ncbi:MAG TPA: FAD:protein FMN transferase [Myxococcota bacterium]|nr:FAD:protein FMN transferase [Myxococcota bacterium]
MRRPFHASALATLLLVGGIAAADAPMAEISGEAFGTGWRVRLVTAPGDPAPAALASRIETALRDVDARMSTWREDSELSRFNADRSTDWWSVSDATARVVEEALRVHRRSAGAFDPTVGPLVALWGFGPAPRRLAPPSAAAVREALERVDAAALSVRRDPPALRKARPALSLDLSAAAKGFAVDEVVRVLRSAGAERFLVEIGGELRARGEGPGGGPWPVAVEAPRPGPPRAGWPLGLRDAALATSGDYRDAFVWRGRRYSHILDPRTGRPVEHDLVSVSVLAAEALHADAWATALLVLGPEDGWRVAEREGLAVLFVREGAAGFAVQASPAFDRHRLP